MNINQQPIFTMATVQNQTLQKKPLTIMDVGAAGGPNKFWSIYGDQAQFIGFEPNRIECERLNAIGAKNQRYFPIALSRTKEKRIFYETVWPESSGLFKGDMSIASRFPDDVNLVIMNEIEMDTTDFDSFGQEEKIAYVDFIKLDCEGGELDVLQGAQTYLNKSVLGVYVEALFQRWHFEQPVFSEIDLFLRSQGFYLYDLEYFRHARKSLPPLTTDVGGLAPYGQIIWGNFLYLRDAVQEIQNGHIDQWDSIRLIKLGSILELFSLQDCALELMKFIGATSVLDLLVPQVNGQFISYAEYMARAEKIKWIAPNNKQ